MDRNYSRIFLLFFMVGILDLSMEMEEVYNNIQYRFTQTDSTLAFYCSFKTIIRPDCLLEIFLNYGHIKALAPDAKEVQLIDQGINWNKIRYIYKKFLFLKIYPFGTEDSA